MINGFGYCVRNEVFDPYTKRLLTKKTVFKVFDQKDKELCYSAGNLCSGIRLMISSFLACGWTTICSPCLCRVRKYSFSCALTLRKATDALQIPIFFLYSLSTRFFIALWRHISLLRKASTIPRVGSGGLLQELIIPCPEQRSSNVKLGTAKICDWH